MKIRMGFVSNSSSSSFIVIAVPLDFKKLTKKDVIEHNIFCYGAQLNEGADFFRLDSSIFSYIKNIGLENFDERYDGFQGNYFRFYKVIEIGEGDVAFKNKKDLMRSLSCVGDEEKIIVEEIFINQHTTENLSSFKETYPIKKEGLKKLKVKKALDNIDDI